MRIIIRRPHAYFFLDETFADLGGIASGLAAGCVLGDGTIAPLPGIYILSPLGEPLTRVALHSDTARVDLLNALLEWRTD